MCVSLLKWPHKQLDNVTVIPGPCQNLVLQRENLKLIIPRTYIIDRVGNDWWSSHCVQGGGDRHEEVLTECSGEP